jgi:hypothetical protein
MNAPESNPDFHSRVESDMLDLQTDIHRMAEFLRGESDVEIEALAQQVMRAAQIQDRDARLAILDDIASKWRSDIYAIVESEISDEMEAEGEYRRKVRAAARYTPRGAA